ncbi:hypothetical protein SAMD00019534_110260 [Acytostelium subglobosum LB1]|uniref:hypothetical protein n=1 Tax=Acytostelium subglobosum LB1 TaxID=1410327 RepID=UPI0006451084|nr:hypothetical protein SAMD00019534_110260 [Acytostelium subglobosum LB1]GAM27850.1 hypothetical protein SAMD00019534_110260 [Acytostelium subglobosum LB1]|eukprot:XP_012749133.1 hypothetical protein SAMD00019534_110260 [Acytostelium subglobosum LB1]
MGTLIKMPSLPKISKNTLKKCLVMFLIANLGYGLQLAYSTPVALSRSYYDILHISDVQYGYLFSIYSLPNLFMIILGGVLIDIMGTGFVSVIFCGVSMLSSVLTALVLPNYGGILAGRFLLGMGGETLLACASTMIPLFYAPSEVPICVGFLACWFYWGNLTALLLLPVIESSFGFKIAIWFVAIVFIVEFGLNLLLVKYREKLRWTDQIDRTSSMVALTKINSVNSMNTEEKDVDEGSPAISVISAEEMTGHTPEPTSKVGEFLTKLMEVKDMATKLNKRFWLLSVICFISYYCMFGLAIIGTDLLEFKFGFDETTAARIMSAEAIINGFVPMLTGYFIQRVRGRKIQVMMFACTLLGIGITLLNVTDVFPLPWIIIIGLGFALLNTTLMSCVPLLVDISIVGTAYGIICTSYNLNIFLFPPLLGLIKRRTNSYTLPLWFLVLCAVLSFVLLIILKYMDMQEPLSKSLDSPYSTAGMDNPAEQLVDEPATKEENENEPNLDDEELLDSRHNHESSINDAILH